jgi:dTMP kinase
MFVTFEGIDGSGKTTQAGLLEEWARDQGHEVVSVREPGGTEVGEGIRQLLLDGPEMGAWTEAALFAAARAELTEKVIRPALMRDAWVIGDRYVDSSLAYQGIARALGIGNVHDVNFTVTGALMPDVTFLLLLSPEVAIARRGEGADRIEREDEDFVRRVDQGYRDVYQLFTDRMVLVEAEKAVDEIAAEVRKEVEKRLKDAAA